MNVVLVGPEIPPNTGNVARLCAATNCALHLIEPLGFRLDDRALQRAGMDYWQQVQWRVHKSWAEFQENVGRTTCPASVRGAACPSSKTPTAARRGVPYKPNFYFATSHGKFLYTEPQYQESDYLVFGRESVGLPEELLRTHSATTIRIPMWNKQARSLNLATAVAIVLYEALRQTRRGETLKPPEGQRLW